MIDYTMDTAEKIIEQFVKPCLDNMVEPDNQPDVIILPKKRSNLGYVFDKVSNAIVNRIKRKQQMKLKDLSWIFLLSTLGLAYCILGVISKVLFEWGGLAIITGIILAALLLNTIISFL